jgi:hypothetical protein
MKLYTGRGDKYGRTYKCLEKDNVDDLDVDGKIICVF